MRTLSIEQIISLEAARVKVWSVFVHCREDGWCQTGDMFLSKLQALRMVRKELRGEYERRYCSKNYSGVPAEIVKQWQTQALEDRRKPMPRYRVVLVSLDGWTEEFNSVEELYKQYEQ